MTALLLTRLGTRDGETLYAIYDEQRPIEIFPAANDDEAVAKARVTAGERPLECESLLAEVARRRRVPTRDLAPLQRTLKAHLGMTMLVDGFAKILDDRAAMDFFEAAYVFAHAVAKDPRPEWFVAGTLRGTVATVAVDRELFFLVITGDEPGLHILSRADADWMFAHDGTQTTDVDHMAIDFMREPRALATELLEPAYGLTTVPQLRFVEHGQPRSVDDVTAEVIAACLGGIGRHAAAKASGLSYTPLMGGGLDLALATYRVPGP